VFHSASVYLLTALLLMLVTFSFDFLISFKFSSLNRIVQPLRLLCIMYACIGICVYVLGIQTMATYPRYTFRCLCIAEQTCPPILNRVAMHLENLEKSGNFTLVKEKSGKLWFACDVLPQL